MQLKLSWRKTLKLHSIIMKIQQEIMKKSLISTLLRSLEAWQILVIDIFPNHDRRPQCFQINFIFQKPLKPPHLFYGCLGGQLDHCGIGRAAKDGGAYVIHLFIIYIRNRCNKLLVCPVELKQNGCWVPLVWRTAFFGKRREDDQNQGPQFYILTNCKVIIGVQCRNIEKKWIYFNVQHILNRKPWNIHEKMFQKRCGVHVVQNWFLVYIIQHIHEDQPSWQNSQSKHALSSFMLKDAYFSFYLFHMFDKHK